jgi:RND family efflux transporter MFP subunit
VKKGRIIAAIAALVLIGGVGTALVVRANANVPDIQVTEVERGELARVVTVSGRTQMGDRADVYPPTAGTLEEVYVEEGQTVSAGDPIAALETEPLEVQVAGAEAAYLGAVAQLDQLQAQVPSDSAIDAADAGADAAYQAYLDTAATASQLDAAVDDLRGLGIGDSIDLGSIETTDPVALAAIDVLQALDIPGIVEGVEGATIALLDTQVASLRAAEDQAYAAYLQALSQVSTLENTDLTGSLESARAACEQARLALELAERTLSEATMTAPIDGVIVFNTASSPVAGVDLPATQPGPGYTVTPASAPFTVVQLGSLRFVADVDEADVDTLEVGMPATVRLDAFPDDEFESELVRVDVVSRLTATGGNAFGAYMPLADTGRDILVGMRGSADIEIDRITQAVSIPIEALFDEAGDSVVYVYADGRVERVPVEIGTYTETRIEITSGLDGGETIALTSSADLEDGMRVQIGEPEDEQGGAFGPFGG